MWCLLMMPMQSASHSFPKLSRLLVKPGMMCPVQACRVGIGRMAKRMEALEVHILPVAMWMVVGSATVLIQRSMAAAVK